MTSVAPSGTRPGALDKKRAALVVLVPAALLLGLTTRTWASGESKDVLSQAVTDVTGGTAAPGVVGLTTVCVLDRNRQQLRVDGSRLDSGGGAAM